MTEKEKEDAVNYIGMKLIDTESEIQLGNWFDAINYLEDAIYELRKLEREENE